MAHMHDEPVVRRETTVIDDGPGSGFGAGMMLAALALVAAVIIGLAILWAAPWDDDGTTNTPSVPGVEDTVPDVPGTDGGTDGGTGGGTDGGTGGGEQPAQ